VADRVVQLCRDPLALLGHREPRPDRPLAIEAPRQLLELRRAGAVAPHRAPGEPRHRGDPDEEGGVAAALEELRSQQHGERGAGARPRAPARRVRAERVEGEEQEQDAGVRTFGPVVPERRVEDERPRDRLHGERRSAPAKRKRQGGERGGQRTRRPKPFQRDLELDHGERGERNEGVGAHRPQTARTGPLEHVPTLPPTQPAGIDLAAEPAQPWDGCQRLQPRGPRSCVGVQATTVTVRMLGALELRVGAARLGPRDLGASSRSNCSRSSSSSAAGRSRRTASGDGRSPRAAGARPPQW
jgi:hypothetical protein